MLTAGALVASYLGTAVLGVDDLRSLAGLFGALLGGSSLRLRCWP